MMKQIFKIALIIITAFVFFACHGKKDDKKKPKAEVPQITVGSSEMVKIPAGPFKMGSDSGIDELEAPERLVTTEEYWIDKYEYPSAPGEMPLTNVTWYKARELCKEQGKDLPTERQWEKACRGLQGYVYPYGNTYDKQKSRTDLSWRDGPAVSGAYPESVSGYGVYDMSGNVWEWTLGESIEERAVRGGFWQSTDFESRCSNRMFFHPTYSAPNIGFRCVKVEKKPKTLGEYWNRLKKRYVFAIDIAENQREVERSEQTALILLQFEPEMRCREPDGQTCLRRRAAGADKNWCLSVHSGFPVLRYRRFPSSYEHSFYV